MLPFDGASHSLEQRPNTLTSAIIGHLLTLLGYFTIAAVMLCTLALISWSSEDPSFSHATLEPPQNLLGIPGAFVSDLMMHAFGVTALMVLLPVLIIGWRLSMGMIAKMHRHQLGLWFLYILLLTASASGITIAGNWPLTNGLGGIVGDFGIMVFRTIFGQSQLQLISLVSGAAAFVSLYFVLQPIKSHLPPSESPQESLNLDNHNSSGIMWKAILCHWFFVLKARLTKLIDLRGFTLTRALHPQNKPRKSILDAEVKMSDNNHAHKPRHMTQSANSKILCDTKPIDQNFDSPTSKSNRQPTKSDLSHHSTMFSDMNFERLDYEENNTNNQDIITKITEIAETDFYYPDEDLDEDPNENPDKDDDLDCDSIISHKLDTLESCAHNADHHTSIITYPVSPKSVPVIHTPSARPLHSTYEDIHFEYSASNHAQDKLQSSATKKSTKSVSSNQLTSSDFQRNTTNITVGAKHQALELADQRADKPNKDYSTYCPPSISLLAEPRRIGNIPSMSDEVLEANAGMLEEVLGDFGIRGEVVHVKPGPVVTLYELRPAPGVKSSRVIGLSDDIARSMSAISARVAVVPGQNVIGIELPNQERETVYLREMIASAALAKTHHKLALCLGKNIGGDPVIADLARMPHLLVAGTTGSGKSVAINTMIMSLLYRLTPFECKLIMIDPKMLELSVYDGIPHLLSPVVTDPKKAIAALKWTAKEMEGRYRKMSKLGVRNIEGYNSRITEASMAGEILTREVQTGFHRQTGEPVYEIEELSLEVLPYIVVIVDEMADLMAVAGKEIESTVQRIAQMARAAGIHLIMATQRPSVDVITGTIKANFPTRVSFQVTSKIDSRTILGEQGAEQLLGQGDMLYMAAGGRIQRVHGPFVSDSEVEKVVQYLKSQGYPEYIDIIAEDSNSEPQAESAAADLDELNDLYDKAVAVVLRDRKASTSYVQRRLQIGYNRAASLIERMEKEGVISAPNSSGKRELLMTNATNRA